MTPAQNPQANGPAAAQGIPDRDPFVETDLFPVLDEPSVHSDRPKGFAALAQPSAAAPTTPAPPTGPPMAPPSAQLSAPPTGAGSPDGSAPAGGGPVDPPLPLEAPPTRHATAPLRPASPPPGPPTPHTLWNAGQPGPAPTVPTTMPALTVPAPARRAQGPLIALACVTGALLLTCGALIGVLWFSGDPAPSATLAAAATTAAPATTTTAARLPNAGSGSGAAAATTAPTTSRSADPPSTSTVPTTAAPTTVTSVAAAGLVADFTWNPDPAVAGQSVTFADASSGGATRWVWTWNGNVVSSSQPKGFTTTLRQDTPVTLTVCRGNGDSACTSVTKMVTVG